MQNLRTYITKETLIVILELLVISFMIFSMMRLGPIDPIASRFPQMNPEARELLREQLGYNDPIHTQYFHYMKDLVQGDFGMSIKYPNIDSIWDDLFAPRIWISFQLGLLALLIGFPLGIFLGLIAARFRNSWFDSFLIAVLMPFRILPSVILIQFCIFIFAAKLNILPAAGWEGIFSKNIIIPLLVLVLPGLAGGARFTRINVLHVIDEDYVRTAYAKGLSSKMVFLRHILPNASLPIVYGLIVSLGDTLLTGFFFVELLYGINGIGKFMIDLTYAFDYDPILLFSIIAASAYLILRRVADISMGVIDPRIRAGEAKQF